MKGQSGEWIPQFAAERLLRGGTDLSGWQVVFPGYPPMPLMDAAQVHTPFDYAALNHELGLFARKANIENVLIKCIQVRLPSEEGGGRRLFCPLSTLSPSSNHRPHLQDQEFSSVADHVATAM